MSIKSRYGNFFQLKTRTLFSFHFPLISCVHANEGEKTEKHISTTRNQPFDLNLASFINGSAYKREFPKASSFISLLLVAFGKVFLPPMVPSCSLSYRFSIFPLC